MDDDCHQQHRHHDQTVDCQEDDIRSLNHGDHLQDEDAVNRYVINPIRYIIFEPHSHIQELLTPARDVEMSTLSHTR